MKRTSTQYFSNLDDHGRARPEKGNTPPLRATLGASERSWELYYDRFDLARSQTSRFVSAGWWRSIPYDPAFTPRKRTALGRFHHEAATVALTADSRVAVYSGDDEPFDYMYKFVSSGRFNPSRPQPPTSRCFDDGILYAARFTDDGTGEWLPLVSARGRSVAQNGFHSQADVSFRRPPGR